jgi:VCBS repeat-containing protein
MRKKLLLILALTILVTSTSFGCGQASSTPSTLTILSITEGDVFVMKAGTDDWIEGEIGMSLEVGDVIKTGDDSGAEITFFDGSTIELKPGTEIEIASLDISPDTGSTTITLQQTIGTTISRVTKLLDPASSYEVETPTGVAAVRGSIVIVTVEYVTPQIINTWTTNQEGNIWFIGQGVELQVPEGQTCISISGQLPELLPENDPPLAHDDVFVMDEDNPVTVAAPGVLANDSDPDVGDTLTVTSLDTSGTVGAVTAWGPDGSFTYDPNGQFEYLSAGNSTTDSYTYTVSDGNGGTAAATVIITINGVNDTPGNRPPMAVDDFAITDEDTPVMVAAPGVLSNDSDPDVGDTLTVTRRYYSGTLPTAIVWTWSDGSFTYDPNGLFEYLQVGSSAIDFFIYTVSDANGGTDNATVIIRIDGVNDAPTDISLDNSSVGKNQPPDTAVGNFSTTDPDTDDTFTYSLVSGEGDDDNDSFTIVGSQLQTASSFDHEANNSYSIRVRTTDSGTLHYEETFIITVTNINDPPVAVNDSTITDEDNSVTVAAPGVLNNDSDPDVGDTLTVTAVNTSGTVGAVTAWDADGSFTYDPNGQFEYLEVGGATTDFFTYMVSDGNGGNDTATVTITINGVNDPPVAVDDSDTTPADTRVTIDVLNNDADSDGDTMTVDSVTQGTHGSVTYNAANVTYTPDVSFSGTDSFTYTISDGNGGTDTASVTVTVTNVNDPPVAVDDSDTTPADTPVTIDVLTNDYDTDGDMLIVDSVTQGTDGSVINNGSNVTYTPDVSFSGTDSFTYTISDGNGGTDTATVSVDIIGPVLVKGKAYVAYEDRDGSDFDYNDFGMKMFIDEVYVGDCLKEITMEFISVKKLAGDSHDIHIRRTLSGSTTYSYTIARSTSAQGTETSAVTNASGQGTFNIVLFDTSHFTSGAKVTIHIKIIDGCEPYDPTPEPPRWDVASIWAHYDPYMKNRTAATEYHIGEWQPAVEPLPTGYDVPYILVIPVTDWEAPPEGTCITDLYQYFDDYYDTGSPENWYN